jgi:hypothetical protein
VALAAWLDTNPEVPEGEWFKRFPGMIVCGEGRGQVQKTEHRRAFSESCRHVPEDYRDFQPRILNSKADPTIFPLRLLSPAALALGPAVPAASGL